MDVSLIIPVFNVGAFLREGLESVLAQNFNGSYEVIIIDDFSSDDSRTICKSFIDRHPDRITYIEFDKNVGVSTARNTGLKVARGRYIMFVDPDDLLSVEAIQVLYDVAESNQADIVKGNNQVFCEKESNPAPYNSNRKHIFSDDEVLTVLLEHEIVRGHPWGKLFLKERFIDIEFPEGVKMAQDLVYCARVFERAKKLVVFEKTVYFYRLRTSGSTGGKYNSGAYKFWFDSVEYVSQLAVSAHQKRALKRLKMRTLHQSIREIRSLNNGLVSEIFEEIKSRKIDWGITVKGLHASNALNIKTMVRFFQFGLIYRSLNKKLKSEAEKISSAH